MIFWLLLCMVCVDLEGIYFDFVIICFILVWVLGFILGLLVNMCEMVDLLMFESLVMFKIVSFWFMCLYWYLLIRKEWVVNKVIDVILFFYL